METRFGLMTKFSSCSLRADFSKIRDSRDWLCWAAFTSDSVSYCLTSFKHSLICLEATESRLLDELDLVFMVSSLIHKLLSASMGG